MTETILRRIIHVGFFAALLVPFIVAESMFFPYITGKAFVFRAIVEIMFAAWVCLAFTNAAYRPRWTPIFVAFGAFLVIIGIANILGENPARSFWSNFERMEGFITLLHVAAYLVVVGSTITSQKVWSWFWNASLGASGVLALGGVFEVLQAADQIRISGTFGNSTYFAAYLLFNIFIALVFAYRSRHARGMIALYGGVAALLTLALYHTGTRGAILGIIAGFVVAGIVVLFRGRAHPRARRIAAAGLTLVVLSVGLFLAFRESAFVQNQRTLERIANISLTDTTTQSRLTLWSSIGWEGFKERPLLGWGQDNFIVVFGKYYDPIMYKQEPWFDRAHNVFVDWAIAGGALGLLAYIALFAAALVMIARSTMPIPEKALFVGMLAAYAVHNLFVFDHLVSYIYFATLLGYLHAHSVPEGRHEPVRKISAWVPVGAGVLVGVLVCVLNGPGYSRASTLIDALRGDMQRDVSRAGVVALYEKALGSRTGLGVQEAREQVGQTALRWIQSQSDTPDDLAIVSEFVSMALEELVANAAYDQNNTRTLYSLGQFLKGVGDYESARAVFDDALEINDQRQLMLYAYAETYLTEKNTPKALEYFEKAFRAEEENITARAYYAAMLMDVGRIAEGEQLLLESPGTLSVDNELLMQTYREQKRTALLIDILENRLKQGRLDARMEANTRVVLASYYIELDKRSEAIAHIEEAIRLHPPFSEQGTAMIQAIREGRLVEIR